eukprot:3015697-Pleurochrysis_carterae.AAC.2
MLVRLDAHCQSTKHCSSSAHSSTHTTGNNPPIRQKGYPIPHKYVEAVRTEVNGLLKAGLSEPGF